LNDEHHARPCKACNKPIREINIELKQLEMLNNIGKSVKNVVRKTDYCDKCWAKMVAENTGEFFLLCGDVVIAFFV